MRYRQTNRIVIGRGNFFSVHEFISSNQLLVQEYFVVSNPLDEAGLFFNFLCARFFSSFKLPCRNIIFVFASPPTHISNTPPLTCPFRLLYKFGQTFRFHAQSPSWESWNVATAACGNVLTTSSLHSRLVSIHKRDKHHSKKFLTSTVTILTLVDRYACRHDRLGYAKMMLLLGFRFPCTLCVDFHLELTTTACIENDFGGNLYLLCLVKGGMQIKFPALLVLST